MACRSLPLAFVRKARDWQYKNVGGRRMAWRICVWEETAGCEDGKMGTLKIGRVMAEKGAPGAGKDAFRISAAGASAERGGKEAD
jgi:hypothetical protein